ncbi:radical SAM protein [Candidatus Pelagibacter sp.]|nr:radical SAM protein [Candidatus Pelagibacter sp.]
MSQEFTKSKSSQILANANLLKKYHANVVYDYTEYPTKGNWKESFGSQSYKEALCEWYPENKNKPVLFYVHTPFCEQLCNFCLCSKEITKDYSKVKNYLYDYLAKEIDMLEDHMSKNNINFNFKEIYLGGGSPTYYKKEEFRYLIKRLRNLIDFNNLGDFTIEVDPRRVTEETLLFYHEMGVNRLSFGIQDFDLSVQEEINRIQPPELVDKLLTKKVRELFPVINFDLLIGLPKQTEKSMEQTIKDTIKLAPSQLQTMYVHYKPNVRKYMIKMVRNEPMLDFFDRKAVFQKASKQLMDSGYTRAGFESYALPGDPLAKSITDKKAVYNSLGTQKGEATNFIAVGSSAHGVLNDLFYWQNFYEPNLYREAIDNGQFPIYRGIKMSKDDSIRREVIRHIRTFFHVEFDFFEKKHNLNFKNYFEKELKNIKSFVNDGLVEVREKNFVLTSLGEHFSPQVANIFDAYNDQEFYK